MYRVMHKFNNNCKSYSCEKNGSKQFLNLAEQNVYKVDDAHALLKITLVAMLLLFKILSGYVE